MAALVNLDAYSLVVSDEVGVVGGIHTLASIAEASHAMTSDDDRLVILHWHLLMDPLGATNLPVPYLTAASGKRITLDERLPDLGITSRSGSSTGTLKLPDLEIAATASHQTPMTVSARLPTVSLSATTGARAGSSLKLPTLEIEATVQGGLLGRLDKTLPGVSVEATGYRDGTATLDLDLPALSASISISSEVVATLAKDLPALRVSATGSAKVTMAVSGTLPALTITTTGQAGSMDLSATLPTLVAAVGTGGLPGLPGYATVEDRYTDYVLRHVR